MSTTQQSTEQAENFRAILLMVASMAGFAFTDAIIKMVSDSAGAGQIIIFQGAVGSFWRRHTHARRTHRTFGKSGPDGDPASGPRSALKIRNRIAH